MECTKSISFDALQFLHFFAAALALSVLFASHILFGLLCFLICRQAKAIQCIYIVTCLSLSLIMSTVRQPPIHQESGEWRLAMLDGTGGHVDVSLNLRRPNH